MVEQCTPAMTVGPPVPPAPPKPSEEPETKSNAEGESDAAPKNPGHGIPARVGDDRCPVHQPRIISRHVDYLRVGRFDDDRFALRRYLFFFFPIHIATLPTL